MIWVVTWVFLFCMLILKQPHKLWVKLVTSKYLKDTGQGLQLQRKSGGSSLWQGIRRTWPHMEESCQHSVRDGTSTFFWRHRWLDSGKRISERALQTPEEGELNRTVTEASLGNGAWNWNLLNCLLPPTYLEQVARMDASVANSGEDELIWGPDPKGKFSILSSYDILTAADMNADPSLWKVVWNWQGLNRVKHFFWLVAHNRLLTNSERRKRHMSNDDRYRRCPDEVEDSIHIIRDCRAAKNFWEVFLPPSKQLGFFSGNIQDWLSFILKDPDLSLSGGIAIWLLWKARNEDIF
ncbi:Putative ribonuclease H protein At1g65750 [Linum perenne]